MARGLAEQLRIPHLDLDQLAWSSPAVRKSLEESAAEIRAFAAATPNWIAEGCYADLLDLLLPYATEIRFLNPGIETCVMNARARPWEPEKYSCKEDQDARLDFLIDWIRDYEVRTDEYSLARHRRLYDSFNGPKREFLALPSLQAPEHPPQH